ncbi:NlpC/P60 family protein [Thiohalocapsa marina]|uniref:NlpC/P60 family protein n=1 Tax=Thiohalocapsa marina TaxID=424902 RepID=A0A5M8FRM3_9GAMM|nr:C40 family peptidase [Thiohalocapsa marina]KAA6186231.1 NlpC/P60 family protein [Thiohalocapsa marina]
MTSSTHGCSRWRPVVRSGIRPILLAAVLPAALLVQGCAGHGGGYYYAGGERFDLRGLHKQRAQVVKAGLSQLGTPYAYGGSEPGRALDCSGLTQYAHHAGGLKIPRMAAAQQGAAKRLRRRPMPGDLVFFKTGPSQYHVGLMVDERRFVHASTSRRQVRLASLDNRYWRERYQGAGSYLRR